MGIYAVWLWLAARVMKSLRCPNELVSGKRLLPFVARVWRVASWLCASGAAKSSVGLGSGNRASVRNMLARPNFLRGQVGWNYSSRDRVAAIQRFIRGP